MRTRTVLESDADIPKVPWPDGAKCAVMLTFDFDAQTLWLSRDPENAKRPGILSQGLFGARVGVPKILQLLRDFEAPGTFFVPGWTAERHTARCEAILRDGHEIGHHGYLHEWIHPDFPDKEEEALDRGLEALRTALGVEPKGYRSPAGESSDNMIRLLAARGFEYNSSLMDAIDPYRHVLADGSKGPIELPWHWSLDDAPFSMFSVQTPRTIVEPDAILRLWLAEFHEVYRDGGLFDLVMHPQFIGRPNRLALLRRFVETVRTYDGVWFGRGRDVAAVAAAVM